MAKCDICGKGVHFGNNVSHSHRRSNRIWNSNIKNVKCKVLNLSVLIFIFMPSGQIHSFFLVLHKSG